MDNQIRNFLIERAKIKAPVAYGIIMQQLELDNNFPEHRNQLSLELAEISRHEHREGRPMLSAMVMYEGLKSFGNGIYNLAEELGFGSSESLQAKDFAFEMQQKCIDYWRAEAKKVTSQKTNKIHPVDFFNSDEIIFLSKWAGKVYDKNDDEHIAAKNYIMNSLGTKTKYWSNELVKRLPNFETFNWRMWSKKGWDDSSGTNKQVARYKHYSWARIFKKGDVEKDIFFTVEANADEPGLVFKLDYYFEGDSNLNASQKELVKNNIPDNLRWNLIDIDELVNYNWDKLIDLTAKFISENISTYDDLIRIAWDKEDVKEVFTNNLRKCQPTINALESLPSLNPTFEGRGETDYIKTAIEKKDIGNSGEELVLIFEKKRLRALGKFELADQVCKQDDGVGYDIISFKEDGSEYYIEVKTTTGNQNNPFDISLNEYLFAERNQSNYKIYRLYNYDEEKNNADFFIIENVINKLLFQPTGFKAYHKL
jgi:hypothetical protein